MELLKTYPGQVDAAVIEKKIVLATIPINLRCIEAKNAQTKPIKNARQLHKHILDEKAFWTPELVKNNEMVASYPAWLAQAETAFNSLLTCATPQAPQQVEALLTMLKRCAIGSTTKLAKQFVKHQGSSSAFFNGFGCAVTNNQNGSYYSSQPDWHKGVIIGYGYSGAIQQLYGLFEEEKEEMANAAVKAKDEITEIMKRADEDYTERETKYKNLANQSEQYIAEKEEIIERLETNYREKLAFEDPADDWDGLSKKYAKSGIWWMVGGICMATIIVAMLSLLILFFFFFYEKAGWFNIARDTALVTVLVGVAIYALRIVFRLSLSSFHLSRDARERHRLTKFYHAMKDAGLADETDRPLIIQSLFSRSDTGLLKDSTPELPVPVAELVGKVKGAKS
jgi:hypothetical protein